MATTEQKVKQAEMLVEEIAALALTIDRVCYYSPVGEDASTDELELNINVIRGMVSRIGWMADLGHKALTGVECMKGGAEQWMLSPDYLQALEQTSTNEATEVSHG